MFMTLICNEIVQAHISWKWWNEKKINGHNLCHMMWNMMTYMLWMNLFVYATETA